MSNDTKGTYYRYSTPDGKSSIFVMPKAAEWMKWLSFVPVDGRGEPYTEFAETLEGPYPKDIVSVPRARAMLKAHFPTPRKDEEKISYKAPNLLPKEPEPYKDYYMDPNVTYTRERLERDLAFFKTESQKLRQELARMKAKYEP